MEKVTGIKFDFSKLLEQKENNEIDKSFIDLLSSVLQLNAYEFAFELNNDNDMEHFIGFDNDFIFESIRENQDIKTIINAIENYEDENDVMVLICDIYIDLLEINNQELISSFLESDIEKWSDENFFTDIFDEEIEEMEKENYKYFTYKFSNQGTEVYNLDGLNEIIEKYTDKISNEGVIEFLQNVAKSKASSYNWGLIDNYFEEKGYKEDSYETSQNYDEPVYIKENLAYEEQEME